MTGRLRDVAIQKIDEQTEALVSMIGDNQVDYRFFIGFKLIVTEEKVSLDSMKKSAFLTFKEFLNEVNHTLMNDFISMPDDEINRYMKMEKLLENKISRRFKFRRLDKNDFGYLIEHIYGRDGVAYEDYEYLLPKKKLKKATLIKQYDLIRPTRCLIEESQRYIGWNMRTARASCPTLPSMRLWASWIFRRRKSSISSNSSSLSLLIRA